MSPFIRLLSLGLVFFALGCSKDKGSNDILQAPDPIMEGQWLGPLDTNTSAQVRLDIQQANINLNGTYADNNSPVVVGQTGTVEGVSSGFGVTLTLKSTDQDCPAEITLSGFNDGRRFSFNYDGKDCDGNQTKGQGNFNKL